jgi:hypothetical protein
MDPEETLGTIRQLVASLLADKAEGGDTLRPSVASKGIALAEQVEALDGWLSRGGHVPPAWRGAEQEDHR